MGFVSAKSSVVPLPGQSLTHAPVKGFPYWLVGHWVDFTQKLVELIKVLLGHLATQRFYTFVKVWLIK